MNKINTYILLALLGFATVIAVASTSRAEDSTTVAGQQLWTCGMHPQIISTEPGLCPICHMKLVPKKDASMSGTIVIDPVTRQNMGIKTESVRMETLDRTVQAFGRVAVPDPNYYTVNVKVNGWVEKLFVNEEGERVFRNQPLLEIYSPDLVTAQKEYLIAWQAAQQASGVLTSLLAGAEERLRNWDVSDDQINGLRETGEVNRTLVLRSPTDGVVLKKMVDPGSRVGPGMSLYQIGNLADVWVKAFVYEQDLPFVQLHDAATVTVPNLPGKAFSSHVIYVAPVLNNERQVEIRLSLDNAVGQLKPDMYAEVALHSVLPGERLTIPRAAVINSGTRQVAYVASGDNTFEPRLVTTGAAGDNDRLEVKSGLAAGEQVVVSGQFMLDSESRLGEALAAGGQPSGAMGGMTMPSTDTKSSDNMPQHTEHVHGDAAMNHEMAATGDPYNIYTCPMPQHYHVLHYGPGTCPECGMALVPVSETHNTEVYVCPMPQDSVVSDKPGKCPVCGMDLVKYEPGGGHDR